MTLTFSNGVTQFVIGSGTPCGIISLEGFDGSNIDIQTGDNQFNGGRVTKQRIGIREMAINFDVRLGSGIDKGFIYEFFSPSRSGIVVVNNQETERSCEYRVSSLQDKQENLWHNLQFELQLKGLEGFLEDTSYNLIDLTAWDGGFMLPSKAPFPLRHRGIAKKTIKNTGHFNVPVWIQFRGPADWPKVINETMGLHVQVGTELNSQQTLHIKTNESNPEVLIEENGVFRNGYPLITSKTSLEFGLVLGDNVLRYESANVNQVNQVTLLYKNRYLGV